MKLLLSAIAVLALVANGEATEATNHKNVCEACVADVSGLHSHLTASNNLRDKLQLQSSLCGSMPAVGQGICQQTVERIVPSLEIKLRNSAMVRHRCTF
jgi:hypothetical protein